ncbi:MAG: hypothetical protein AAGI28_03035 [Pseudomonadota bacterium]
MKIAEGARPWPIVAFGMLLTTYGIFNLIAGLSFLENEEMVLRNQFPDLPWNRDWVIVWVSAQFTIVLIPIVAICAFASRFARILITAMALVSLPWIWSYARTFQLYGVIDWVGLMQSLTVVIAAGLLYLPASSRWLRQEAPKYEEVFD